MVFASILEHASTATFFARAAEEYNPEAYNFVSKFLGIQSKFTS